MNIINFSIKRIFFIYLIVSFLLYFCILVVLNRHKNRNFSDERYMELVAGVSDSKDITDNMCKYMIFGDPKNTGDNYIKIEFVCRDGTKQLSSLSTIMLGDVVRLEDVVGEIGRILNVSSDVVNKDRWSCHTEIYSEDNDLVQTISLNWTDQIKLGEKIICYEN